MLVITLVAFLTGCVACPVGDQANRWIAGNTTATRIFLAADLPTLRALIENHGDPPEGAIAVPNGSKGRIVDTKFLKGGQLVMPYPADSFDMERDGAVRVVLFEVTEGPKRGAKGWIRLSLLIPDFKTL